MRLRVVQWNISWKCNLHDVAAFIRDTRGQGPTIVYLEEVQFPSTYCKLRDSLNPMDLAFQPRPAPTEQQ